MQTAGRHAAQIGREANRQAYAEEARQRAGTHGQAACRGSRRAEEQPQTGRKEKGAKLEQRKESKR